ncbi:MAG: hypothetical protein HC945_02670 [Nitrosarchaeum sp.]|nr:hypothetical protein [Nitrosarchaeum sp.]
MALLEVIGGNATAPSTTETILTAYTGNSYNVRDFSEGRAYLVGMWADVQGAGIFKIRSARMHDISQGFRVRTIASELDSFIAGGLYQELYSNDQLLVSLSGSGTAGDIEQGYIQIMYDAIPGLSSLAMTANQVNELGINILTVECQIVAGTGGGWSGSQSFVANFDLIKANKFYAVLGATVSAEVGAVRLISTDFGNLGVGVPGNIANWEFNRNYFINLANSTKKACVPVFRGNNARSMTCDVGNDENANSPVIAWHLVELIGLGV